MNEYIINLLKELGVPIEFHKYHGKEKTYITFFEYNGLATDYSDDEIDTYSHHIQIDIWSDNDYTDLVNKVKNIINNNKITKLIDEEDLYEDDTNIYHKGIRIYIPEFIN